MPEFKNEMGETKYFEVSEVGKKRKVIVGGIKWKKVPRYYPPSRADRLSAEISKLYSIQEQYQSQSEDGHPDLSSLDRQFDSSEIESLRDEIENWKSGMEGTNLESTSKYEELSECLDNLENAISSLESIDFDSLDGISEESPVEEIQEILSSIADQIGDIISELENVSFPGMF
jgi:hypothetical protein